ncbi:MAG: hypothetical protein K0S94_2149 [Nitrospira sp.]|nr:hypothetical protein [Nitrospira sp.]
MAPDREGSRWGLITGIAALTDQPASRFIQLDTKMWLTHPTYGCFLDHQRTLGRTNEEDHEFHTHGDAMGARDTAAMLGEVLHHTACM